MPRGDLVIALNRTHPKTSLDFRRVGTRDWRPEINQSLVSSLHQTEKLITSEPLVGCSALLASPFLYRAYLLLT
jgi:hypothetical protein